MPRKSFESIHWKTILCRLFNKITSVAIRTKRSWSYTYQAHSIARYMTIKIMPPTPIEDGRGYLMNIFYYLMKNAQSTSNFNMYVTSMNDERMVIRMNGNYKGFFRLPKILSKQPKLNQSAFCKVPYPFPLKPLSTPIVGAV